MSIKTTAIGVALAALLILTGCSSSPSVTLPEEQSAAPAAPAAQEEPEETTAPAGPDGSRNNPYPVGATIEADDWTVTINSVNLDAASLTADANMFNDPPAEGNLHILVNATLTYTGAEDGMGAEVSIAYVTPGGVTVNSYDKFIMAPDELDSTTTLYEGGTITGNIAFEIPADGAADGVLVVTPGMFNDKVFIAVQ